MPPVPFGSMYIVVPVLTMLAPVIVMLPLVNAVVATILPPVTLPLADNTAVLILPPASRTTMVLATADWLASNPSTCSTFNPETLVVELITKGAVPVATVDTN